MIAICWVFLYVLMTAQHMYVYIYTHIYIYIYTYLYIYICIYTHVCVITMYIYIYHFLGVPALVDRNQRLDTVLVIGGLFDVILAMVGGGNQDGVMLRFVSAMTRGTS